MTKRAVKPKEYAPTGGPPGTYQGDLIFFDEISRVNRGYKSILTVISANSRFVYAEPLKKKSDTSDAMRSIIKNTKTREPIKILWTDPGTEFTSKKFQDLMKTAGIQHRLSGAKNHAPLGRIDRFHLTLRTIFERWFLHTGKNNWVDSFPEIIESYNKRVNRAIGMAPADTTPKHIEQVRLKDKARAMRVASRVDKLALTPGTKVRYITNRVGFTKGSAPKWSSSVHEIRERLGVDIFKVEGLQGTYKDYELQAIPCTDSCGSNDDKKAERAERGREKEKKDKRAERRIRREGIEPRAHSPRRLRHRKK